MDAHIADRLNTEIVGWLATVRPDGQPHNVPVWFGWYNGVVAVFSPPGAQKVRDLRANPRCTLSLETADGGNDVVIIEGSAQFPSDDDREMAPAVEAFVAKYRPLLPGSFDDWRQMFALPILIRAHRILAWSKPGGQLQFQTLTTF